MKECSPPTTSGRKRSMRSLLELDDELVRAVGVRRAGHAADPAQEGERALVPGAT